MSKILLVDDAPVIQSVLKRFLARPDREFLAAENAAQALQLAMKNGPLDVALVDKNLPDRTGLEVARELKHLHPDIEIILLTGYASLDSAIEAVKVGAFDYISKPITDFEDLGNKVQKASDKVRLKREQRRLLDRFSESEERYRGVFQASSDAILVCDAVTGKVQDANQAAERLYGYSGEEVRTLRLEDFRATPSAPANGVAAPNPMAVSNPPGPSAAAPQAATNPASPPAGLVTEPHRKRDGRLFMAELSGPGRFAFQRRGMVVYSVRDVSERCAAELQRVKVEEGKAAPANRETSSVGS